MRIIIVLFAVLLMSGCASKYIVDPQIVNVDHPVPYCPGIEDVISLPPIDLESLKLTDEDQKNPGKVSRAYHIDMVALTQRLSELNRIEAQRKQQATEMKAQLEKYQQQVDAIHKANMDKVTTEVLAKQKALNSGK